MRFSYIIVVVVLVVATISNNFSEGSLTNIPRKRMEQVCIDQDRQLPEER